MRISHETSVAAGRNRAQIEDRDGSGESMIPYPGFLGELIAYRSYPQANHHTGQRLTVIFVHSITIQTGSGVDELPIDTASILQSSKPRDRTSAMCLRVSSSHRRRAVPRMPSGEQRSDTNSGVIRRPEVSRSALT
ncbi:hypothetical protein CHU98_g5215 [Xylaria longipes]|nr:hypothetical protein CHU98_g5215 [Xylaria longipes]